MSDYDFPDDHTEEKGFEVDGKLQNCRVSQKELDICTSEKIVDGSWRRTWSGLDDSLFDVVQLPTSLDASVQTTATLHRTNGSVKIETTV
ncbi:hypothetical protein KIN20_031346 [Parelaphostrongylus tenuis]|uniref:Uncharacterized protein n=1 Tax=Parelaphostrongylus tenuis TaxID=148309 RepID=A0AAD5WH70_PARTN|nr:hypothetical protein KIN20_031346 [Parelaphostrongylus tenuis]